MFIWMLTQQNSSETTTNEVGETVTNDSYHQVYDQISKFQVLNQLLIQVKMNNLKNYKKPTEMIGRFLMVTQIHCKTFTLLRQTHHQM